MHLVYEHKTNGMKLVPNGLSILDDMEIAMILSTNPEVRMMVKAITPGKNTFDIYKADLRLNSELAPKQDDQASKAVKEGNDRSEQQAEKPKEEVPWMVFMGHEWEQHSFEEVTILFPESQGAKC